MLYFSNPKTEEELKEQYRKLLLKYDYRLEKNVAVIQEIQKEYKEIQMQIKRGNGYRTVTEKIVDTAKSISSDIKESNRMEQQRINQLKNRNYTQAEIQSLINQVKRYVDKIVRSIVEKEGWNYTTLRKVVLSCDTEQICRWFNRYAAGLVSNEIEREYDNVREKLEYALKSKSNDKRSQETYMVQMEKMVGNQIISSFHKYEDELVDPIYLAEQNIEKYKMKQHDKKHGKLMKYLMVGGWIIWSGRLLIEGLTNKSMNMGVVLILIPLFGIMEYLIYFLVHILPRKIDEKLGRKTFAGLGNRKHKTRVSERKQYESEKARFSLLRLLLKLFT